jgi:hypothetical protein
VGFGSASVGSGSAPGGFPVGSRWFPGRLRVVPGSAPSGYQIGSGYFPGRLRMGSGSGQVGLDLPHVTAAQNGGTSFSSASRIRTEQEVIRPRTPIRI